MVVPKFTGLLQPLLNLSDLIAICTYLHLRCLLSNRHGNFFTSDNIFSIDLNGAYLHIPIVKHHHHFFFVLPGSTSLMNGRFYHWLGTVLKVFTSLTKPILSLCRCQGFMLYIFG